MNSERSLAQWVEYIQTLHVREIDLTLERVREVFQRLYPAGVGYPLISIAGTNGKGSTAGLLASIYAQGGYSVGKFTSPHLVSFNERYQIGGADVSDQCLLESFQRIEQARGDVRLTYFEFGTLLAIDLFSHAKVDIAIMEVGLGGRLDAVNILDADVAIVTSLSVDHSAWLGDTVEQIAMEKIGIARPHRPCIIGVAKPPANLIEFCQNQQIELDVIGMEFSHQLAENGLTWDFDSDDNHIADLALPFGQTGVQLDNACVAIQAISKLGSLPLGGSQIKMGIAVAHLDARCQRVSNQPLVILDVSHNEASVQRLSDFIKEQQFSGRLFALCGMLADKEVVKSLACLMPLVDHWALASIHNERGSSAQELQASLQQAGQLCGHQVSIDSLLMFEHVTQAYKEIRTELNKEDCLVVFGSFHIVGDIMPLFR